KVLSSRRLAPRRIFRCRKPGVDCLQILHGSRTVAGAAALPADDVSEAVLDRDPLAQSLASSRRGDELSEPVLQLFVVGDGDRASCSGRGARAFRTQRAVVAGRGVELDVGTEVDALNVTGLGR